MIFPTDSIVFEDSNDNSVINLKGKIHFYNDTNNNESFQNISYDISFHFHKLQVLLQNKYHYFAVKDGNAQVLHFYVNNNSSIDINATPFIEPNIINSSKDSYIFSTYLGLYGFRFVLSPKIKQLKLSGHLSTQLIYKLIIN